jgi:sugar lactone lactonase YvrE
VLQTLTGFSEPQGVCSDGAGHFWVANTGDSNVLEYSTEGTLLGSLADSKNYPVGCAYDPKTGDLAVTNIITTGDGAGNVAVYRKAKGTPKIYTGPPLQRVYSAAYYGSTGTLVVDGENSSYDFAMASLKGGRFKEVTLKGATIEFPGGLGWSTKVHSMNVCDQESAVIYRFLLSGKVTGTIPLNGSVVSFAIFGGTLLAPTSQGIAVYAYPAGGAPKRVISEGGFSEPIGIAVSSAVTE